MKRITMFVLFLFILVGLLASLVSAEPNYYDRKTIRPAWCPNMVITSSNTGPGSFYLTIPANSDRISGEVINLSTSPISYTCVYSASTSTALGYITSTGTIVAHGGTISATNTTDDSDKFFFRRGNVVYTGPLYLATLDDNITYDINVVEILKQ